MVPTTRLRLVRTNKFGRDEYNREQPVMRNGWAAHEYKLQQWWQDYGTPESVKLDGPGEWRDVPVEEECI